jgi:hypothetical protein
MINQLQTQATKLTSPENFKKVTDRLGDTAQRSASQLKENTNAAATNLNTVATNLNNVAANKMEAAANKYDGMIEMIDVRNLTNFGKETTTQTTDSDTTDTEKNGLSNLAESFANLNQFDLGEISNLINDLQAGLLTGDIDQEGIFLLQSLLQQQMQLISTISNVQKQQHDAQMAVINNIR